MSSDSARNLALSRLLSIEERGAFTGFVSNRSDDVREERLAHEYVSGVTRWRRWLDFLIDSFYSGDSARMEIKLRVILRIGIYDILNMSTPDHAAVHESVELAKSTIRSGAGRLANAILRALLRSRESLPTPDSSDRVQYLGTLYSHPDWIVRRWLARMGEADTVRLLASNNVRPRYSIRHNRLVHLPNGLSALLDALAVEYEPGYSDSFVSVTDVARVLSSDAFGQGALSIQDEAAGMVVQVLGPEPGETIVDVCAAPGGKATYAAEMMTNTGRVLAIDRHERRLRLVAESAQRLHCSIVETIMADATQPLPVTNADRVLVDAPCSGLGVLAKRVDLRWRMTEQRLEELVELQAAILHTASQAVRGGGTLVYSTCTLEPEENELQVARFVTGHPDFSVIRPAEGPVSQFVGTDDFYRTLPHVHAVDGAFAAKLRRND